MQMEKNKTDKDRVKTCNKNTKIHPQNYPLNRFYDFITLIQKTSFNHHSFC